MVVGAGLSAGAVGPMVHMACCWGNIIARLFSMLRQNETTKREIMSACVSAGVSAAFGACVGGVLFSMESASTYFSKSTMWYCFYASCVAILFTGILEPNITSA